MAQAHHEISMSSLGISSLIPGFPTHCTYLSQFMLLPQSIITAEALFSLLCLLNMDSAL